MLDPTKRGFITTQQYSEGINFYIVLSELL